LIRKALLIPLIVAGLVCGLLLVAGHFWGLTGYIWLANGFSALLVLLAVFDWWMFALRWRLSRKTPDLSLLNLHAQLSFVIAVGGSLFAVLGLNFLLGSPLPRGIGLGVLLVAAVLLGLPPSISLYDYYRGRP